VKVAVITDTHFGARGDSPAMQKSQQRFLDKVFFPTIDDHGITRVLHGGDYGDRRKYVNYQTANFINAAYRTPLKKRGIVEDVIVGNHDIFYKSSTIVNSLEELYRFDPSAMRIYTQPTEIDVGGLGVLMLPWITENNREASEKSIATSKAKVVLSHLELNGFQMYRGMPHVGGMSAGMFERFGLVMSGHFHHRSSSGPVHYLGAAWPMIWSDYNDPRGFHIFDTKTMELEFIENPYSIFKRIVYDDEGQTHDYVKDLVQSIQEKDGDYQDAYVKVVVKSKTQSYWFNLMMDSLYKMNAQDIIVVDDIIVNDDDSETTIETTDVDTLGLMNEFVDALTISCDKPRLKTYLQTKYREAIEASQSVRLS